MMINTFAHAALIWHLLPSLPSSWIAIRIYLEVVRVVPRVVWVVPRVVRVVQEAVRVVLGVVHIVLGMLRYRDFVHRAKNASIDFDTRRLVFCQVARGRVDWLWRAPCTHET